MLKTADYFSSSSRAAVADASKMMPSDSFPTLETERLRLREVIATDARAVLAIHGDAELMRLFGNDPIPDLAGAEALIKTFASWRQLPNPGTRWAIEIKGTIGLIGTCGLFGWNKAWKKCVVGYELAKHVQGNGYMHEALDATLSWGFKEMDLNRVEAQVHPGNEPSLKLLRRLRFIEEGRLRQCGYWAGRHHDLLLYSLLHEDWTDGDS
jgi:ribosomal-protein-alanine N-acetyltransferase